MRIDAAEIVTQGSARHLGDRPGHFDPRSAAADNDEGEQAHPLGVILNHFRPLEGEQKPPPDLGRVGDVLEPGRKRRPVVMAEIGMGRSRGEHQIVVGKVDLAGVDAARREVDRGHPRHGDAGILLLPQDGADRPGDVGWRQRGSGDLVEQRLKTVMVVGVDDHHVGIDIRKCLGCLQAAEAGSGDDHPRSRLTVHALSPRRHHSATVR